MAGTFLFLAGAFLFVAGAFQFLAGTFLFMVGTFLDTVRAHRYLWRAWAVGQGAARDFGKGDGGNSAVSSQAIPGPGPGPGPDPDPIILETQHIGVPIYGDRTRTPDRTGTGAYYYYYYYYYDYYNNYYYYYYYAP